MTRKVDHLVVHCSATKAKSNITATDIDKWHRARGWFGCGYHYVITRDGTIQSHASGDRCRPLDMPGAHVGDCGPGWNKRSIGICMVGGLDEEGKPEDNFTGEQWVALDELVNKVLKEHPTITHLGGHRDLIKATNAPPKACPCFDAYKWFSANIKSFTQHKHIAQIKPIT